MARLAVILSVMILLGGCCHQSETVGPEVLDGTRLQSELDIKIYLYHDSTQNYGTNAKICRLMNEPDYEYIVKWIQKPNVKFEPGVGPKTGIDLCRTTSPEDIKYFWDYLSDNNVFLVTIEPFEIPVDEQSMEVKVTRYQGPLAASTQTYILKKKDGYWYHYINTIIMEMS